MLRRNFLLGTTLASIAGCKQRALEYTQIRIINFGGDWLHGAFKIEKKFKDVLALPPLGWRDESIPSSVLEDVSIEIEWRSAFTQVEHSAVTPVPELASNVQNTRLYLLLNDNGESHAEWVNANEELDSHLLARRLFAPIEPVPVVFRSDTPRMFHDVAIRQRPLVFATGKTTSTVRSKLKTVAHSGVGVIRPLSQSGEIVLFFGSLTSNENGWRIELDLSEFANRVNASCPLVVDTHADGSFAIGYTQTPNLGFDEVTRLTDLGQLPATRQLVTGNAEPCPYYTIKMYPRNQETGLPDLRFSDER